MKKYFSLALSLVLSFSTATPSFALHADKPYTEAARQEASTHIESLTDSIVREFLEGNYQPDEYLAAVSESYIKNFIAEVEKVPALKGFNVEQYASINPQILFVPRSVMGFKDGYAYDGRIMINFGRDDTTMDKYKQIASHELIHLGTNGLGIEWLEEVFAVLFAQRLDEGLGREPFSFDKRAAGRNDFRIGELLSQLIGGEEEFVRMASEKDAYALIAEAFDGAQGYISFADFSFANISIRADNEEENFAKNLEYLEYMVKNPQPAEGDKMAETIRAFYTLPSREAAEKFADGISALVSGYEIPVQSLDYFTRMVIGSSSDDIFYSGEVDALTAMEDAALLIAYEYVTPAFWEKEAAAGEDGSAAAPVTLRFLWADAVTALRLERFVAEYELSVSARSVMDSATAYALSGELLETVFGPENIVNYNYFPECVGAAFPEMQRIFAERTGKELETVFEPAPEGGGAGIESLPPDEMLGQIVEVCFVQPVKDGVLDKEKAAEELGGFREKNFKMLEGRKWLEMVDAALAEIGL